MKKSMLFFSKRKEPKTVSNSTSCGGCGLPVEDPTWRICPRCRAELAGCDGCRSCGNCSR